MLPFSIPWKHQKTNISNLPQLQDIQFTLSFVNHCGFQRNFFLAISEKLNLGLHQPFVARIDYVSWLVLQTFVQARRTLFKTGTASVASKKT